MPDVPHHMIGQTIKEEDGTVFEVIGTRQGRYDLVYVLKAPDGGLWEIQDHDVGTASEGGHILCGERWPAC